MTARLASGLATPLPDQVDVLVVGLGVTGAGVALDAASRGLSVLAVDAHDVAFGTSRWSSKLVHGGLRYLAHGQVGVAAESARERGLLMTTIAPHLTRAVPFVLPLTTAVDTRGATLAGLGFAGGDLLRRVSRTPADVLPRPRRLDRAATLAMAPFLRVEGLRGGLLSYDGQLVDDARLVTCIARTAAAHGARVHTRLRVTSVRGTAGNHTVEITDGSATTSVRARAVVNATGVWAGGLDPSIHLRPSRGTHLVLRAGTLPGLRGVLTVPVPGSVSRFVMVLPQFDGTAYVGLTDEPVDGPIPDVPEPSETEIGFLLDVLASALAVPLHRDDVAGAFAGLRPLLAGGSGETSDLSRRHAVLTSDSGMVSVVGGKLTTYRRMAEDALDAAVAAAGLDAGPCRTASLPLLGAADRDTLAHLPEPPRLVARYGTEAAEVLAHARAVTGLDDGELLAPIVEGTEVTRAELIFGVTHEGAVDVADLLDRRTRVGLVPDLRAAAEPVARWALETAQEHLSAS